MAILEVGDIQFRLTASVEADYEFLPQSYQEFLTFTPARDLPVGPDSKKSPPAEARPCLVQDVELIPGLPALPLGLRPVTTAGPWSILGEGEFRYLVWHGLGGNRPIWYARFSLRPGSVVTVFCGDPRLREREGKRVMRNPFSYPLDQILTMYLLAEQGGLLIHAAGLCGEGQGLICAGKSRAGKSTVSRLWLQSGRDCVSDDRIVLRPAPNGQKGRWTAFGTPWPGELKVARQARLPARALVFLQNAGDNRTVPLSPQAAFERLLPVVSLLWFDPDVLQKGLSACEALAAVVPAYEFGFTRDERAVSSLRALLP